MPIFRFSCKKCGKIFDKILSSSDISFVTCSGCDSPEVKRKAPAGSTLAGRASSPIPAGALSGGSCKSGFS